MFNNSNSGLAAIKPYRDCYNTPVRLPLNDLEGSEADWTWLDDA